MRSLLGEGSVALHRETTAVDAWIAKQPDPKPSRREAIRRLIERGLKGN